MAPKIFVFFRGATVPAPWTSLTRTNNYIRLVTSYAAHMQQMGSATHTPVGSGYSGGSSGGSNTDLQSNGGMAPHSHSEPASWTISANNNDPPYYGLDIIYMDLAVWESQERRFPAGTVFPSNAALTESTEIARFTLADGRFILHATPGSTGGTTSPQSHRVQGTLPNTSPDNAQKYTGGGGSSNNNHGHTVDLYSDAKYVEPRNLVTRLYEALTDTTRALENMVAFVDDTPTSNWEILSGWADANLKAGNSNPTLSGSDTHSQSISGYSSSYSSGSVAIGGEWGGPAPNPHSHPVYLALNNQNHVPLSRQLIPMRLKSTLYHVYVHKSTYTFKTLIQRTGEGSWQMGTRMRAAKSQIWDMSPLIQKRNQQATWTADLTVLLKDQEAAWDMAPQIKVINQTFMMANVIMIKKNAMWQMSVRMIKPGSILPPVIDTLYRLMATEFSSLRMQIDGLRWANQIENAKDTELDERWGKPYKMHRFSGESDDAYRLRLKTYMLVTTGCGTRPNCEAVLNTFVGEGGSNVATLPPGEVKITFNNMDAMRRAKSYLDILNEVVPKMLAAGVGYTISIPYTDWLMDVHLRGVRLATWEANVELLKTQETTWDMSTILATQPEIAWDMAPAILKDTAKLFEMDVQVQKAFTETWTMSPRISKLQSETWEMDIQLKNALEKSWQMASALQKTETEAWEMNVQVQKTRIKFYNMGAYFVLFREKTWDMKAVLSKLNIKKKWTMKTALMVPGAAAWDMGVKLV